MKNLKFLSEYFKDLEQKGLIKVTKHDIYDLYIYNYTHTMQWENAWDDINIMCRGLILDSNYNVISKPFDKFFNLWQAPYENYLPKGKFKAYEKMDGSLGISYRVGDDVFIATRGSFNSEQATFATNLLNTKYKHIIPLMDNDKTYLFEIIYPDNRIVVDYEGMEDIVLLAVIDNTTFKETLPDIGFNVVKCYGEYSDANTILDSFDGNNREGMVLVFDNGFRTKVKYAEYCRLHRIMTNVTEKSILDSLINGDDLNDYLTNVPDEFYKFVESTISKYVTEFECILFEAIQHANIISDMKLPTQRDIALEVLKMPKNNIIFCILNHKDYTKAVWKVVKNKYKNS